MSEWLDGFSMAWGMFLAIPCPLRRWNEKAREKMLVCLPLVGLAVGGIWLGLYLLLRHAAIGGLYAFLMAALPWLVTGFMHLDGYMDVCDAVLSRRELATRQRILKDSHCGAFAVIGMVLFSTYSMVMDNGKTVRNRVLERESERVFWGILDNDIAGLCLIDDKRSTLPPLSREPIVPSDAFYRLTETDKPQPSDDEVLLSFATSSHLADMPGTPLPGPVCVEYVLRNGNRSAAFIRRERAYCGVEGEEKAGLCTGTENYWSVNKNAKPEDIQATLDFLKWVVTSDAGTTMMSEQFGACPFKSSKAPSNPFSALANEYVANGCYPVTWAFNFTPAVNDWRAAVVDALSKYTAGNGSWDDVKTAFVDGWATQYANENA